MRRDERPPLIVVGASAGGLDAVRTVLSGLPRDLLAAVAIVQHRRPESETRLVELLEAACEVQVAEPDDRECLVPGRVYVAPADYHLLIEGARVSLSVDPPVRKARPSIDVLFESAAQSRGYPLCAVLLTASSEDGADGTHAVHQAGGLTIVQDPITCESGVAGAAALARFEPSYVVPIGEIAPLLAAFCGGEPRARGAGAAV